MVIHLTQKIHATMHEDIALARLAGTNSGKRDINERIHDKDHEATT